MSGRGFNWLKRVVLPVGVAAMDVGWLYPWALFLGTQAAPDATAPLLSATTIFALLITGWGTTRLVLGRSWPLGRTRFVLTALGLLAALLAVRVDQYRGVGLVDLSWLVTLGGALSSVFHSPAPSLLAAVLALFLWWRGLAHGRRALYFEDVLGVFRLGSVAIVGFSLVIAAGDALLRDSLQARAAPAIVGFLFASLTSLALARLEAVREQGRASGERGLGFNRHWLAALLSVVAALLILTLALAQLLSFDLVATVAAPLLGLLGAVAWILLYAVAVPIGLLIEGLVFLVRLVLHPGSPPELKPPDMSFLDHLRDGTAPQGLPAELAFAAKWASIGLLALVVLVLLARTIRHWHEGERDDGVAEERDSVWTWALARVALCALLDALRRRFAIRRARTGARGHGLTLETAGVSPIVLTVREIYRQLLSLGASAGVPRARATTPYEHLPALRSRLKPGEDLAAITEAYVQARYGAETAHDGIADEVRARWRRVQARAQGASPQEAMRDHATVDGGGANGNRDSIHYPSKRAEEDQ